MKRGSITVFFSLMITILCSLFFSMSETIRILGMHNRSDAITSEALASAYSEYQPYLWETYQILTLDGSYGQEQWEPSMVESRVEDFCWNHCSGGNNFFEIEPVGCQLDKYCLLTDGDGAVFMQQASKMAKMQMTTEAIEQWVGLAKSLNGDESNEIGVEDQVNDAQEALKNPSNTGNQEENKENVPMEQAPPITFDNPFEIFSEIKEKGWLGMVIEEGEVSDRVMSTDNVVSKRQLQTGTKNWNVVDDGTSIGFYQWYLLHQFKHFGQEMQGPGLAYQVEYIIAGENCDRENLKEVVSRLIAMREVENVITITSNPQMLQQAYQLALSLAGASANPALIQVVQGAVVAVWALVESILDVRTLLDGGKVAMLKTSEQWTSQLFSLAAYITPSQRAKETETGISYVHYLASQLILQKRKSLGLRPLDLMEEDLRQQEEYTNARMDRMICSMEVVCRYESYPLFLSVMGENTFSQNWYSYECKKTIAY